MGAWIETEVKRTQVRLAKSHPVWVRGLKHIQHHQSVALLLVAPRVGAWIETEDRCPADSQSRVAPRVGAWIETNLS